MTRREACPICLKHRGEGTLTGDLLGRTNAFWVWHSPKNDDGLTRLGYVRIESDRHATYLDDLGDDEAAELGRLRSRLARALRNAFDAEFVFAAVAGTGIAHFHEHVFARRAREPKNVAWYDSDELLELGDSEAVAALTVNLRDRLEDVFTS